jgi:hypothetical protein
MGGKASRDKGSRGERQLRDHLREKGWHDVLRVPLSGASQGFKGDVVARADGLGQEHSFELKVRAGGFDKIYKLLTHAGSLAFCDPLTLRGALVTYDPNALLVAGRHYVKMDCYTDKEQKVMQKILKMREKWLGDASFLVIKQDRHPFIFVRFV